MKILLVTSNLSCGGAQRAVALLGNHWSKTHKVELFTFSSSAQIPFFTIAPAIVRCSPPGWWIDSPLRWKVLFAVPVVLLLRRMIARTRPDIIVSFLEWPNLVVLLATLGSKIPVIISERTIPRFSPLPTFLRPLRRSLYRRASAVVGVCSDAVEELRGIASADPALIEGPVRFFPRSGVPLLSRSPVVLNVGRISEEKRLVLLVRAFAAAAQSALGWKLQLVGSGPEEVALRALVKELQLEERVEFVQSTDDVGQLLENAQIFALTSRFEGYPGALAEAMAAGLACVAFDAPGAMREMFRDGQRGVLVPDGNVEAFAAELQRLFASGLLRSELGRAAQTISDDVAPERQFRLWDDLLNQCVVSRQRMQSYDGD